MLKCTERLTTFGGFKKPRILIFLDIKQRTNDDTSREADWIKDTSQGVLTLLFYSYVCHFKAILSSLNASSGLSSEKRRAEGAMSEAHLVLVLFALGLLSYAACLSLDPLVVTLAVAGIPPLCIPLVYSSCHPSINDPFTEAAGRGRSGAPSTF